MPEGARPLGDAPERAERLARLDRLAQRLDRAFRVPFTRVRIGYDSLLGLVPGIGDALAMAPAGYILLEGHRLGASRPLMLRMAGNVAIDALIGTVPLLGDLFDIGWKANTRNVALLRRHLGESVGPARPGDARVAA